MLECLIILGLNFRCPTVGFLPPLLLKMQKKNILVKKLGEKVFGAHLKISSYKCSCRFILIFTIKIYHFTKLQDILFSVFYSMPRKIADVNFFYTFILLNPSYVLQMLFSEYGFATSEIHFETSFNKKLVYTSGLLAPQIPRFIPISVYLKQI